MTQLFGVAPVSTFKYVSDPIVTHASAAATSVEVAVLVALVVNELLPDVIPDVVAVVVAVDVPVVVTDCPGISLTNVSSTKAAHR